MVLVRDALHATGYAQDTRVLATGWRGPLLSQDRPQTGRNEKQDIGQQSLSQNELSYSKLHATRMLAKTADWRPNRRLEFLLQPLAITWRTMVALEYVVLSVPKSLRSVTSLSSVCNTAAQQPHGTGPRNKAEKPQTDGTTSFNGREDEEATRGNHCF